MFFSFLFTLLKFKEFFLLLGLHQTQDLGCPTGSATNESTNIRQLFEAVAREWQNIHWVLIQNACDGMVAGGNSFSN